MGNLIQGIFLGGLYAAVALGLTLVFGVMRLVNLAHGELLIGSAYFAYVVATKLGLDPLLSMLLVSPGILCAGYAVQRLLLNPLLAFGMEPPLVGTFGISIVTSTALVIAFSADTRSLNASYSTSSVDILGHRVTVVLIIGLAAAVGLVAALQLLLSRSRIGRALRAASEDPEAASAVGVDVRHVHALTFGLAAVLATIGGVLIALAFGMTPSSGTGWLLRAFTVIVLGGMGSVGGTLAGGIIVGIAEVFGSSWAGPQYRDLIVFSLLVGILVLRPRGLFGKVRV